MNTEPKIIFAEQRSGPMLEFLCLISLRCSFLVAENRQFTKECMDRHMFGETEVPHLQWHGRRSEIIQRKD